MPETLSDSASINLRRLCLIRTVVLSGQCLATVFAVALLDWALPVALLSALFAAMALVIGLSWWRSRLPWPITDEEFVAQLLVDVAALTAVMYLVGGASNPFVSFFLVPICIAATTLPWRHTALVALAGLLAYSALLFAYRPLAPLEPHYSGPGLNLHVVGMWFNFAVSAVLITYFVVQMAAAVRRRDQALAKIREQRLQDAQLLAVATLAAGTAHELGTPLATMRIATDELLADNAVPEAMREELLSLDRQLTLCKDILTRLTGTARDFTVDGGQHVPVSRFFSVVKEHWQLLRPAANDAPFSIEVDPIRLMVMDTTLEQAVINLLNNAADASPGEVKLRCYLDNETLVIEVDDAGPGMTAAQMKQLGKPFVSGKGLGLGLFVSQAAASRYGGELTWTARKPRGTRAALRLPAAAVMPEPD